ncbi:MAG TPA: exodeoxyribonuclease III [Stellaceae bacterium]|nr:exodeoxyribonuclease III [Stellaceae bacterium]
MKIATWNINSVRLRIGNVVRFLETERPDVLCLQETKTPDEFFPGEALDAIGYRYRLVHGMKGYNGVAILSRLPFQGESTTQSWCERTDCRHGWVRIDGGIELHNLYIPAGGDIPDPVENPKFAHKLRFVDEIAAWFAGRAGKMILVGDLNIAPLEHDVWSHKQLLTVVSHTPIEVEKLGRLQAGAKFVDAVRHFVPPERKLYSWWSYRNRDWSLSDRGRRLDHIWLTPELMPRLESATILREMRGWESASDHVPVIVELA